MQCKRRKWIIQCYVIYFFSCVFKQLIGVRIRDIPNNLLLLFSNMEFIIEVFVPFPRTACALVWCVMIYYPTLLIYMLSFSFRVAQSKWMTLGSTTEKQNTITSGHITCVCKNTNMELFTVRHFFFSFLGTPKVEYAAMVMVRRITAHQQRTHMHNRMTFHCIACLFLLFFVRAIF